MIKNNNIISENTDVAEIFNKFFVNRVKDLNITMDENVFIGEEIINTNLNNTEDSVLKAIRRYRNHPSILATNSVFSFKSISYEDIENEIKLLDIKKASQDTDIPTKIIKQNADIVADFIYQNFNNAIACSVFPVNLKNANISPVHKKESRENEANYRPISILPNLLICYKNRSFALTS